MDMSVKWPYVGEESQSLFIAWLDFGLTCTVVLQRRQL